MEYRRSDRAFVVLIHKITNPVSVPTVTMITVMMNIAFLTWENVYWLSQLLLVAFAGLALVSGRMVNNRQAEQLLTLQTELATAKSKQAEAEKSLLELKTRLAPRSLSQESRNSISQAVKQFAPQTFDILWYPDDQESLNFANQIFAALKDAGWVLNRSDSWLGFSLTLGIVIEFVPAKSQEFEPAAKALAEALQKEGVAATVQLQPEIEEKIADRIRIRVGKKP